MRRPLPAGMAVGTALLLLSCADTPTETALAGDGDAASAALPPSNAPPFRGPTFHTARVDQDGNLVDGTAIAASHMDNGSYLVEFPSPISHCAGTAQNALFPGSNSSQNNVTTQILIGFGPGLEQHDTRVTVNHHHTMDPTFNKDSGFNLILVCPG